MNNTNALTTDLLALALQGNFSHTRICRLFKEQLRDHTTASALQTLLNHATPTSRQRAEQELTNAQRAGVTVINFFDPHYPQLLTQIDDPPLVLFTTATPPPGPYIAIVGTRQHTDYGFRTAFHLAKAITECGGIVVSGLARGIDAAAHQGALAATQTHPNRHPGVAVLGCGLNAPTVNRTLQSRLVESGGILLSEYGLTAPPRKDLFPRRNRIISGLAEVVIIVEAAERSGSLITARLALEQGRDVWTVPGSIESTVSTGTNTLAQQGARVLTSIEEFLYELGLKARPEKEGKAEKRGGKREPKERRKEGREAKKVGDRGGDAGGDVGSHDVKSERVLGAVKSVGAVLDEMEIGAQHRGWLGEALGVIQERGRCSLDRLCQIGEFQAQELLYYLSLLELEGIIERGEDRSYGFCGNVDTSGIFSD